MPTYIMDTDHRDKFPQEAWEKTKTSLKLSNVKT